jgi:hypothetical protein
MTLLNSLCRSCCIVSRFMHAHSLTLRTAPTYFCPLRNKTKKVCGIASVQGKWRLVCYLLRFLSIKQCSFKSDIKECESQATSFPVASKCSSNGCILLCIHFVPKHQAELHVRACSCLDICGLVQVNTYCKSMPIVVKGTIQGAWAPYS